MGGGTLGQINVGGDQQWGGEVADIETFLINADQGLYRLYVPYPPDDQILRYEPTADGSGFSAPNPYFVASGEDVAAFHQLLVDGDVYAVTSDTVLRYFDGRDTTFALDQPPDNGDLRPGHDYRLMTASGDRGVGQLFVWDKLHQRIVVFDKATATYVEQFVAAPGSTAFADIVGMYLVDSGNGPPVLYWPQPPGSSRPFSRRPVPRHRRLRRRCHRSPCQRRSRPVDHRAPRRARRLVPRQAHRPPSARGARRYPSRTAVDGGHD